MKKNKVDFSRSLNLGINASRAYNEIYNLIYNSELTLPPPGVDDEALLEELLKYESSKYSGKYERPIVKFFNKFINEEFIKRYTDIEVDKLALFMIIKCKIVNSQPLINESDRIYRYHLSGALKSESAIGFYLSRLRKGTLDRHRSYLMKMNERIPSKSYYESVYILNYLVNNL
jgi:hypothetical protein